MNSSASLKETVSKLIDNFARTSHPNNNSRLQARLSNILKDNYTTESDTTIHERFCGIEEKCRILHNDELADALLSGYKKLDLWQSRSKHDVISFLLYLADNPVDNTRLDDLQYPAKIANATELTWNDILKDSPWDDETIWHNIDYAASSSNSQWSELDSDESPAEDGSEPSSDDNVQLVIAEACVDDQVLSTIIKNRKAYPRRASNDTLQLTETQLIRESIFMFQGLPSIVYQEHDLKILSVPCRVEALTLPIVCSFLIPLCKIGSSLSKIRYHLNQLQETPLLQAFQACLLDLVHDWEIGIAKIEQEILSPQETVYTLLSFTTKIDSLFQPLNSVVPISRADIDAIKHYLLLESLFQLIIDQESMCNYVGFKTAGVIFQRCLEIYLRPIRMWIEFGVLDGAGDFFVRHNPASQQSSRLRQDAFSIVFGNDGRPKMPYFLHDAAHQLFTAGKGINLLRNIDPDYPVMRNEQHTSFNIEPLFAESRSGLNSFEEQFQQTLAEWLHLNCSVSEFQVTRIYIEKSCLRQVLSDIEYIYFQRNGSVAQHIAYSMFDRIDRSKTWKDKFYLTDLYQESLTSHIGRAAKQVSVLIANRNATRATAMQELAQVKIKYDIPRIATLALQAEHLGISQGISTLLLQLTRTSQLLDRSGTFRNSNLQLPESRMYLFLQQWLRWFVSSLRSHITTNVLQIGLFSLHESLDKANNLEQLIETIDTLFKQLQTGCLLQQAQGTTLNAVLSILELVVLFSGLRNPISAVDNKHFAAEDSGDSDNSIEEQTYFTKTPLKDHKAMLHQYSTKFDQLLGVVIAGLREMTRASDHGALQSLLENLQIGLKSIPNFIS